MRNTTINIIILLTIVFLLSANNLFATEEYAERVNRDCRVCHLDPSGGGELTPEGEGYALSLKMRSTTADNVIEKNVASDLFRLFVGYLHILFGFFWFGTILYVHLILKPAYASGGLPRSEVKLGLLSMVVMGITGAVLFAYRVPDSSILFNSRFGVLLLIKIILYLIMVGSALFAVFFLGPRLRKKKAMVSPVSGDLTLEQLTQYDGKEGRAAYFAYNGGVYNATDSPLWKKGSHMGRHQAGSDLTDVLGQAPHGEDKVLALPRVGSLLSSEAVGLTPPQKLFYSMAYLNLGFVLLIILILACWKWW